MRAVVAERTGQACVFDGDDATAYFPAAAALAPAWRNEVTLGTLEMAREYEPAVHIERISPTPLLMIVATGDGVTPTDLALDAYSRAREPKRLVLLEGGHFDPLHEAVRARRRCCERMVRDAPDGAAPSLSCLAGGSTGSA